MTVFWEAGKGNGFPPHHADFWPKVDGVNWCLAIYPTSLDAISNGDVIKSVVCF